MNSTQWAVLFDVDGTMVDNRRFHERAWIELGRRYDTEITPAVLPRIDSPFYSVDMATRDDGQRRVVEVGDGQVSDLVGWTPEEFARALETHFCQS